MPALTLDGLGPLPNFDAPPVMEVALGLQFEPLPGLTVAALSYIQPLLNARGFEPSNDIQPLPRWPVPGAPPSIEFGLSQRPEMPRVWYSRGDRLLQIQRDRIIYNWRRSADSKDYPRFPVLLSEFTSFIDEFREHSHELQLDGVSFDVAEVTYVNRIPSSIAQLSEWVALAPLAARVPPAAMNFQAAYRVNSADEQVGDFFVNASSNEVQEVVWLNLTARVKVVNEDVTQALEDGRKLIVTTFVDITTKKAHDTWRLHS